MENFNLDGFHLCHLDDDAHGILREKRIVLGLTQQQVADKAKIVLQQYQKFESGERSIMNCSFEIACRVIEALGMNISDFYHGKYTIGEEVFNKNGELHYNSTGKSTNSDVE